MTLSIRLRDPTEADLTRLYEYQLDPDASRMAAFPPRDWEAFLAHWAKTSRDEAVVQRSLIGR